MYKSRFLVTTLLIITLTFLSSCGNPQPVSEVAESEGGSEFLTFHTSPSTMKFENYGNLIFINVTINDIPDRWFILDSGFEYSLLNLDNLEEWGIEKGETRKEMQPGGEVEITMANDVTLSFAHIDAHFQSINTFHLDQLQPIPGRTVDGIVGHDVLMNSVAKIDYEAETITFIRPDEFTYDGDGEIVPVSIEHDEPFIQGLVIQPGREPVEAKLKVDTGSVDFIGFNGSFVKATNLIPDSQPRIFTLGSAVGGHTRNFVTRLQAFKIGSIEFENPVVGFSEDLTRGGDAGTIAGEVLSRFTVIFDYQQQRMILDKKNSTFDKPFEYDMSGVFPIATGDDFDTIQVISVTEGSPSANAGLQAGDVIEEIDGVKAGTYSIMEIRSMFKMENAAYRLKIRRGEETFETIMTLTRQI